jgi:hypothetical protein
MKTFTRKGVQTIHRSTLYTVDNLYAFKYKRFPNTRHTVTFRNTIVELFLKHFAIPLEVTLYHNYPR